MTLWVKVSRNFSFNLHDRPSLDYDRPFPFEASGILIQKQVAPLVGKDVKGSFGFTQGFDIAVWGAML